MSSTKLNIAVAAGGTAGHINPALAMAEELRDRGHHVTFYGQHDRLEATLVPEAGFDFVPLELSGFDRSRPWTLISALYKMKKAQTTITSYMKKNGFCDVAIGFGAYIELPLINVCHQNNIPCLIHEQNSVPGLANKRSAKKCHTVCVSFPCAANIFKEISGPQTCVVVTGNPVRKSVLEASSQNAIKEYGIAEGARVLLVFGGSLGAKKLNDTFVLAKDDLLSRDDLYIIHATGKKQFDEVKEALNLDEEQEKRYKLVSYIKNMGDVLSASDLVISRAGASSIAEISALATPSILVPYPHATADHQTKNASFLNDVGGCVMVDDSKFNKEVLEDLLVETLDNKERLQKMRKSCQGLGSSISASALADQVEYACGYKMQI